MGRLVIGTVFLAVFLLPSGCRSWDNPLDPLNNHPPYAPTSPSPDSGATGQDTSVVLGWTGGDPDSGDVVHYDVYFGSGSQPPLIADSLDTNSYRVTGLGHSALYRWRVVAKDSRGDSTTGPLWSFTTWAVADTNHPPNIPSSPQPSNGATGQDTSLALLWTGGDPDSGDVVTYDLYFGTSASPPLLVTGHGTASYDPGRLAPATLYYWKVVAHDNHGDSAAGPVWSFTTIAAANRPPNSPSNPTPVSGASSRSVRSTLSWSGGDPDPGDTVVYDMYFGTSQPPPLVAQDHPSTTFSPGTLDYDSEYYWKVVARDNHSASAEGPVWQFHTMVPIVVTKPDSSSRWRIGSAEMIEWTGGVDRVRSARLPRVKAAGAKETHAPRKAARGGDAADSTVVFFSTNNGTNWIRHGRAAVPGQYAWQVPGPAAQQARVLVRVYVDSDSEQCASSSYEVYDTLPPSTITVTAPAGGEQWEIGTAHSVVWHGGTDGVDSTVVYYSSNGGLEWQRQGRGVIRGTYLWQVPGPETDDALIQVRAYCLAHVTTGTSGLFEVTAIGYPDSVVATVGVGQRPTALCWSSLDDKVYVANRNSGDVSVIDGSTNTVLATVEVGSYPVDVVYDSIRNKVYVANEGSRSVSVIDCGSDSVVATIQVGVAPRDFAWDRYRSKLYIANYGSGANSVSVIDAAADTLLATVAVGERPYALCSGSTNKVFAVCYSGNEVSVINAANDTVEATIEVGGTPCAAVVDSRENEVYVAARTLNRVTVIDGQTNGVITHVNVSVGPCALAWNSTTGRVYAACGDTSLVAVISTANHQSMGNVVVGQQPTSLLWVSLVNVVYVANYAGGSVSIFDGATNGVLKTLAVGNAPTAVCWNDTGRTVYVANYDDGTVSVIGR